MLSFNIKFIQKQGSSAICCIVVLVFQFLGFPMVQLDVAIGIVSFRLVNNRK